MIAFLGHLAIRFLWVMLILNMCVTMSDNRKPRREVISPPGHADCTTDTDCYQKHGHEMFYEHPPEEPPKPRYIVPTNPKGPKPYEYWKQNY